MARAEDQGSVELPLADGEGVGSRRGGGHGGVLA